MNGDVGDGGEGPWDVTQHARKVYFVWMKKKQNGPAIPML